MIFECNFHIVIHVTGLEIIFYILKKRNSTIDFSSFGPVPFTLALVAPIFCFCMLFLTFSLGLSGISDVFRLLQLAAAQSIGDTLLQYVALAKVEPGANVW